jgi:hypothetical protein
LIFDVVLYQQFFDFLGVLASADASITSRPDRHLSVGEVGLDGFFTYSLF